MSCFNNLAKATTLLATAGLASTTILNVPSAHASDRTNCENGQLIGTFALRSERNQQFVKKDDGILKASKNSQPTGTSNKGVFEIYSLKDMPGATDRAFALRSTRNNKWWRVTNGSEVVRLESYQCRSDRDSTTFIGRGGYGALSLQSRKNGKWIKVLSNEKLKAKADNPESKTVFRLVPIGQSSNPQPTQPSDPTPPQATQKQKLKLKKTYKLVVRKEGNALTTYEWEKPVKSIVVERPEAAFTLRNFYPGNRPSTTCKGGLYIKDFDTVRIIGDGTSVLSSWVNILQKCNRSNQTKLAESTDINYHEVEAGKHKIKRKTVRINKGEYNGTYLTINYFLNNKDS